MFTLRLMACMGAAGLVSEVLPLQRSYWVPLTVAIVFKPDYGSVFARALQRGIGTVVGAVAGAVLLVLVHGTWLLIPFGVLAALLPFGRSRNYGLLATFLTPLVVVLIDLLNPGGWRLAEDRLIDTLIGCAIVLLIGFAPWPMSWYSHLPRQYARAALDVCRYLEEALDPDAGVLGADAPRGTGPRGAGPSARSRMRRSTYRALADLRAEFQRTMSEPPSISRRATAWWPAVVALEQVMDAGTATALAVSRGAQASPSGVRQLCDALRAVSEAAATGSALAETPELPDDETLRPVTDAVRALLGVLGTGERLTVLGRLAMVGWSGSQWSGWPDSNRRPPRPKRGALAKLRYSPYLAECSGCPGMFAVRTGSDPAVPEAYRTPWIRGFTAWERPGSGVSWRSDALGGPGP